MKNNVVVFDLGGVLLNVHLTRTKEILANLSGKGMAEVDQALFGSGLKDLCDRGQIPPDQFAQRASQALGVSPERFAQVWTDMFSPITPNIELLAKIAQVAPVYVASNTDPLHMERILKDYPWIEQFTGIATSYALKSAKPSQLFFQKFLRLFDLRPEECLFLDDKSSNVEAAKAIGMGAVHVRTPDQLANDSRISDLLETAGVR